jgi:branched-chain amino acid transport system ATP-binding protein
MIASPAVTTNMSQIASRETPALSMRHVTAGYRGTTVIRDLALDVPPAAVVALLGANGAGKTTTLRLGAGLLKPLRGQVLLGGVDATRLPPHRRARKGVCLIPEGRGIFRELNVRDNLRMQLPPWERDEALIGSALDMFPDLKTRMNQTAGSMSGGQQQMLALCRAWIARPDVVLLDEVSMGLAPRVVDQIFVALRALAASGTALLIVEQYMGRALEIADVAYLLSKGELSAGCAPSELDQDVLMANYFGVPNVAVSGAADVTQRNDA